MRSLALRWPPTLFNMDLVTHIPVHTLIAVTLEMLWMVDPLLRSFIQRYSLFSVIPICLLADRFLHFVLWLQESFKTAKQLQFMGNQVNKVWCMVLANLFQISSDIVPLALILSTIFSQKHKKFLIIPFLSILTVFTSCSFIKEQCDRQALWITAWVDDVLYLGLFSLVEWNLKTLF